MQAEKTAWQAYLGDALAPLCEHLTLERVAVNRDATSMKVFFTADRLVGERDFIAVKRALQKSFAGVRVSLRLSLIHISMRHL